MQVKHGSEFLRFAVLAAGFIAGTSLATAQQSTPVPATALQTYTASDQSASVGVPAGWNVTKAAYGLIQMSGPKGESISLGNTLLIRNGPYRPGQNPMTIPNQATLTQRSRQSGRRRPPPQAFHVRASTYPQPNLCRSAKLPSAASSWEA